MMLQDADMFQNNSVRDVVNVPKSKTNKINFMLYNLGKFMIDTNE